MPDSIESGKMTSSVDNGVLTIRRRTYRSGGFVHVVFSAFSTVFAVMFFALAVANDAATAITGFTASSS